MTHAKLSPSSSARWLSCTSSVKAIEPYENSSNSASIWGTNVHKMGEMLLNGEAVTVGDELQEQGIDFIVDNEMLKCAEEYADYVNSFITKDSIVIIEEQYDLSVIAKGQFGTSDATVLNGTHLHIMDLKTGHGIVYAESNTQMMLYAVGAVEELGAIYDIEMITLHIVQTRAGHIDTWELHYEDLMKFQAYAKGQADKILSGDTEFKPNAKACQWCDHKTNCDALKTHVDNVVKGSFENLEDIEGKADIIDLTHVKKILDNADLITGFIKAIQERALEVMQTGEEIAGYKMIKSRKNKAWSDKDAAEKYLIRKLKLSGAFKRTLITPTQALKALGKDATKYVEKLITTPEGDLKVVPNAAKGEAIMAAIDKFDDIS